MKFCESCGIEIYTVDGDNRCESCDAAHDALLRKVNAARRARRHNRESILRSCGLTKVKGSMGGTYWE
jgi:hypothetical protein